MRKSDPVWRTTELYNILAENLSAAPLSRTSFYNALKVMRAAGMIEREQGTISFRAWHMRYGNKPKDLLQPELLEKVQTRRKRWRDKKRRQRARKTAVGKKTIHNALSHPATD